MTAEQLGARIDRLQQAAQRTSEALLEIELDPNRELLDHCALTGATAAGWQAAGATLALAWATHAAVEALIERVRAARGTRARPRQADVDVAAELLFAVTFDAPGGARETAERAIERAGAAAEDGRRFLLSVGEVWGALVPRLTTMNATLRACGELADELGAPPSRKSQAARQELVALTDAVACDPLAASPAGVVALEGSVAAVRAETELLRDFRRDADGRLAAARALLDAAREAERDAHAAHRAALEKTASAEVPAPPAASGPLAAELDRIAARAASAQWQAASEALADWTTRAAAYRDAARRIADANRAPIRARNELRGLLGAYQAKAHRLLLLEDPELAALFDRAQRALHTAPTDLIEAARLVRAYQDGVSAAPHEPASVREAPR
jgi:hypothetical protein